MNLILKLQTSNPQTCVFLCYFLFSHSINMQTRSQTRSVVKKTQGENEEKRQEIQDIEDMDTDSENHDSDEKLELEDIVYTPGRGSDGRNNKKKVGRPKKTVGRPKKSKSNVKRKQETSKNQKNKRPVRVISRNVKKNKNNNLISNIQMGETLPEIMDKGNVFVFMFLFLFLFLFLFFYFGELRKILKKTTQNTHKKTKIMKIQGKKKRTKI